MVRRLKGPGLVPSAALRACGGEQTLGRTLRPSRPRSSRPPRGRLKPAGEGAEFPPRRAKRKFEAGPAPLLVCMERGSAESQ